MMMCYSADSWHRPKTGPFDLVFEDPRPACGYYHYSNSSCQGALIAETARFPWKVDRRKSQVVDVYLDRIWEEDSYKEAAKMLDRTVEYFPWDDDKLKRFARAVFQESTDPEHVRLVYYYNIGTGYSCPYLIAVFRKESPQCPTPR